MQKGIQKSWEQAHIQFNDPVEAAYYNYEFEDNAGKKPKSYAQIIKKQVRKKLT